MLEPVAPLPPGVRACVTLRGVGGEGDFASRLADSARVSLAAERREQLRAVLGVDRIEFLAQVHGIDVHRVEASSSAPVTPPRADAAVSTAPGVACAVLTADCLPVLFWSEDGACVGAAHAGWRGLAAGVLEATVAAMVAAGARGRIGAWLGAAIGPESFEVGPEVRRAFLARQRTRVPAGALAACFRAGRGDRWFADLYALARARLDAVGVSEVTGGGFDTFADAERFHSYRRDGDRAGRQASLIWIEGVSRSS